MNPLLRKGLEITQKSPTITQSPKTRQNLTSPKVDKKIQTKIVNPWSNIQKSNIFTDTKTPQVVTITTQKFPSAPKKKDVWASIVNKYLKGVKNKDLPVLPHHNSSYQIRGKKAEQGKIETDDKEKLIQKGLNHTVPQDKILKQYSQIRVVKTMVDDHPTLYIPCKRDNDTFVLEITLNSATGAPHHSFYRPIWHPDQIQFLEKSYGNELAKPLQQMVKDIQEEETKTVKIDQNLTFIHS